MVLMHKVIIDIQGFNQSHFWIFDDADREDLLFMWNELNDVNRFIAGLSPAQRHRLALWAVDRTSYSVAELTNALEKFTKYLKSPSYAKHPVYPKPAKEPKRERHSTVFRRK